MQKRDILPKEVLALFEEQGVDTENFLYAVTGDMDGEGSYCTAWVAFDAKGLYAATGQEELVRQKKRLTPKYTLETLLAVPIEDMEKLKTERYLSTGRLISEKGGEDAGLVKFSIGLMARFEDFCKAFNAFKEGKDLDEVKRGFAESPFCPKCGTRFPEEARRVCPKCIDKRSTVVRLFTFFGGYKKQMAVIFLTLFAGTALSIFVPLINTRYVVDSILTQEAISSTPAATLLAMLGAAVLTLLLIALVNTAFKIISQHVLASILPWVIYDIKLKIFGAMQKMSVGFYSSKQTGSLMQRVNNDTNQIYWFFVDGFPYTVSNVVLMAGIITAMFVMNWKLALIAVVTLPLVVIFFKVADNLWHRLHHKNWVLNSKVSSMVSDSINGHRIIKAFSKEEEEAGRFSDVSSKMMGAQVKLGNTDMTVYPLIFLFIFTVTTVITAVGGVMVVRGKMSLGNLMTFVIYLNLLHGPLDFLSWVNNWWARCVDSAQRVFEIVDTEPDIRERESPVVLERFDGGIEISELEFEYEPARPVIKKLNLKVEPGQMLGIVGKTGAGKTTISNLIARLYDPKAGAVKIDGVDVRDMQLSQLRENIGLVSQEIYLFMGTIADNIRYAKPEASIEEVIAAAKAASAHDFIMKLPDTYETRVGAGGQDLSGGERQRVSIARTIIQNPKILILDEATAAMDTETERNIQESLTKLKAGRTTLAIAHRLSTLRDADVLAVIDDGKVVEYGTYIELMKKKGEYYKLYQIQAKALKYVGIGED